MSDREPEAIDTLRALVADSTIAEAEAYWRADERRKVIAELTAEQVDGEESEVVYGVMEVIAAEYGASDNATAHAVLDRVASLLAPGAGNDKDVPADFAADKSAISGVAPSPEQAREGDDEITVRLPWHEAETLCNAWRGSHEAINSDLSERAIQRIEVVVDATSEDARAHEEGSTNGTS